MSATLRITQARSVVSQYAGNDDFSARLLDDHDFILSIANNLASLIELDDCVSANFHPVILEYKKPIESTFADGLVRNSIEYLRAMAAALLVYWYESELGVRGDWEAWFQYF